MIDVCFFASLREQLECERMSLPADAGCSVAEVRDYLIADHPHWTQVLQSSNLLMAVNQQMARLDAPVRDGDEVAFFPPVTGG
ncbi:MAG TPA: molybdopterin converting factor subunit 1 [Cellvibrionaceae bacterium]